MNEQQAEALALGHAGAEQAHGAANNEWRGTVHEAFEYVIHNESLFTSDDIYAHLGGKLPDGADPRAIGAVFRRFAAADMIRATNDFRTSNRRTAHGNPKRVWRSLVVDDSARPL